MKIFKVEWKSGLSSGGCIYVAGEDNARATMQKVQEYFDCDDDSCSIEQLEVVHGVPADLEKYEDLFYR